MPLDLELARDPVSSKRSKSPTRRRLSLLLHCLQWKIVQRSQLRERMEMLSQNFGLMMLEVWSNTSEHPKVITVKVNFIPPAKPFWFSKGTNR